MSGDVILKEEAGVEVSVNGSNIKRGRSRGKCQGSNIKRGGSRCKCNWKYYKKR